MKCIQRNALNKGVVFEMNGSANRAIISEVTTRNGIILENLRGDHR